MYCDSAASSTVNYTTSAEPVPSSATPTQPQSSTPQPSQPNQGDFASILQQFAASQDNSYDAHPAYTLPDVFTPAAVLPLLSNLKVREALYPFLPVGLDHDEATLRRVIHSSELRRSLAGLDTALRTGVLGPFVQGLGLDQEAALGVSSMQHG